MVAMLVINGVVVHGITRYYQDWKQLETALRELDYGLVVSKNRRVVCSSLDRFQEDLYCRMEKKASWPEEGTLTVQNVGRDGGLPGGRIHSGGYALAGRPPPVLGQRPQSEAMLLSMLVSGVATIGVIVLLSFFFTRCQIRQVMRPVHALAPAAKRVEEGDLSTPVDYQGKDEFSSVCAVFDHMQGHLLAEREKNALHCAGARPLVLTLTVKRVWDWENLRFADNGRGVPEDQLPHLFEQFWRGDQARGSRGGEGSGLGLYIVKCIVEAHGGTIQTENDGGLVFEIALPHVEEP